MPRPCICPHCKSKRTARKGFRRIQKGKVQLCRCKACGKRFTTKKIVKSAR